MVMAMIGGIPRVAPTRLRQTSTRWGSRDECGYVRAETPQSRAATQAELEPYQALGAAIIRGVLDDAATPCQCARLRTDGRRVRCLHCRARGDLQAGGLALALALLATTEQAEALIRQRVWQQVVMEQNGTAMAVGQEARTGCRPGGG